MTSPTSSSGWCRGPVNELVSRSSSWFPRSSAAERRTSDSERSPRTRTATSSRSSTRSCASSVRADASLFTAELVYLVVGVALLLAVLTPTALERYAISAPLVLLVVGMLAGLLPAADKVIGSPLDHLTFLEHLTEFTMIVALMGVGLALDRPLMWRSPASWRRWGAAWRLLALAMPLTIAGVALLGWSVLGLAPASALLLGAVLAPTDPVLASEVQVEGPTAVAKPKDVEHIDEEDEVRFALTSEAGLNDGMTFPSVYAAIFLVPMGAFVDWGPRWLVWELGGKVLLGALIGTGVGWLLAKLAFRAPYRTL